MCIVRVRPQHFTAVDLSTQEAHQGNVKLRETEAKIQRAKEAKEKAERERSEKKSQKRAIEAMMEGGDKEGVMDSLLEALQSGSAFSREGRKKRPARPAGGGSATAAAADERCWWDGVEGWNGVASGFFSVRPHTNCESVAKDGYPSRVHI